jgi:hypothetical protein
MLVEGLNIFTDYVYASAAVSKGQGILDKQETEIKETENSFGEEIGIKELMEYNRLVSSHDANRNELDKLKSKQASLEIEIKDFFRKFPKTKRVSLKPQLDGVKEWFVIYLSGDTVKVENVKA